MFAWLAGWDGTKFSVVNWAGAASVYLLLSEATTLFGAMIFAARIGTAFTVEIGSMQMSGQLDALRLMAVEPTQYIVIPRVLASILCLPILKAISDGVAILPASALCALVVRHLVRHLLQHVLRDPAAPHPHHLLHPLRVHGVLHLHQRLRARLLFPGRRDRAGPHHHEVHRHQPHLVIVIDTLYGVMDSVFGWSTV